MVSRHRAGRGDDPHLDCREFSGLDSEWCTGPCQFLNNAAKTQWKAGRLQIDTFGLYFLQLIANIGWSLKLLVLPVCNIAPPSTVYPSISFFNLVISPRDLKFGNKSYLISFLMVAAVRGRHNAQPACISPSLFFTSNFLVFVF